MTFRPAAVLVAALLGIGLIAPAVADDLPDPANPTALLEISKTVAPTGPVGPGDEITYSLQIGCSAISDVGCRDAITTDLVPEPLVIDSVIPSGPNDWESPPTIDGQKVTVRWQEPLGGDAAGMLDNQTSQVIITVHVPDDVSYDYDGQTIRNTATAEATNAADDTASADITLDIPLDLATSATKSFDPDTAIAGTDTDVTATLTGTNDSNATVDSLVIQDPTDPSATPNPFTYLGFTGFGDIEAPPSATSTTCSVFVPPAWVSVPSCDVAASGIDPDLVRGTRVTFGDQIPPGESATVDLDLRTTDLAASASVDTSVVNNIRSEVVLGPENATGSASDTFDLQANAVDVGATKQFDPSLVVAGQPSTVTLTGTNESAFTIDSLTLTEPSSGGFPDAYELDGIGPITYPANATGATVTYQPGDRTVSVADGGTPAEPTLGWDSVESFSIEFTGPIVPGAEATVPFDVATDPDFEADDPFSTVPNEVAVEGENDGVTADDTARDDLLIYGEAIHTYIDKTIRPTEIISDPGQLVTVSLAGGTTERPTTDDPDDPDATTGRADQVVIQDPEDPLPNDDPFWNAFDLSSIAQTPIPADATLTIYYWDADAEEWVLLDGPISGPDIYSSDVPAEVSDVAGGVRFVFDYTGSAGGFDPGTDFAPNFTASLRPEDDGRYESPAYDADAPDQLANCAQSDATSPTPDVPSDSSALSDTGCPTIDLTPTSGDGGAGDLIEKHFNTSSSGGEATVIARSGDTIPSTLSWSTAGYTGYEQMRLQDVVDPTVGVADTMYDAFNLIRVNQITPERDPYLVYDQIDAVQLYNGTTWVDAGRDPCPEACDGTFPGVSLTAAEQESTLAVRLVYVESPTRGARTEGDLDAPPVGSGVARSSNHSRHVALVWEVRDTHRSVPSRPALGDDSPAPESTYNTGTPGLVNNDASASGFPQGGGAPVVGTDDDQVQIIDVPITEETEKDWLGGPVAVPTPGTPADQYPRTRLRVRTTNTTPAKVDQLEITDPAPGSTTPGTSPFDYFDLARIAAINVPTGATTTQVVLTCADGTTRPTGAPGYYTREQALDLTTMPCPVVRFEVLFDGRIDSGANGAVALDVRLRATNRTTGADIEPDTAVANTAQGVVADVDAIQDCPPGGGDRYACGEATAGIQIVAPTFGVVAGKTIDPSSQFEGDDAPVVVTVSAENTGSARPYYGELTDDDATFWNAMDFVQMDPSWTLPSPVEFVQACYLAGGDFDAADVAAGTVGGTWTCQALPGGGPPFIPGVDLTLDQARAFIASAPSDLHGLRFRFMANSELGFQNPVHPLIEVPFQVQRRDDLRSGGPVPTTRSDQTPAPGESEAGIFEDTVDVHSESVLVGSGPDDRLVADDDEDATYTYEHLTVGVKVDKGPGGELPPGEVIPFTLAFTNTGDAPLHDPVFTDVLPSDAEGNQLIFDPDSDPAITSPYEFDLAGAAPTPSNGDPLPVDQDEIVITQVGDTITFEMPDGAVLEVGQTYTITIDLVLRPGLTSEDEIDNTATVISDEPFDPGACAPTYRPISGVCQDTTTVSPIRVAALSTVKKVKADVPVVEAGIPEIYLDRDVLPDGVDVADDYCDGTEDAAGFYRAPCVPVTYPGDRETWRFTITNAGTLPIDTLVSIDSLPHVGDRGLIVTLPRDTEWDPTFADGVQLVSGSGGTLTTFYSSDEDPCIDDLDPLGTPCPDGDWEPLDASVDPAAVASLKFVVGFPEADLFEPGEQVTLEFKTRTTPDQLSDSAFPVAWNTVATGGSSIDDGTRARVTATEGRKVGVTYPTGPIRLQKVAEGDGSGYAPDTFDVQLECAVDGEPMTGLPVVTLPTDGAAEQVDGLPWGAECTASETNQGQTTDSADSAIVGGPDDPIGLVTVTNVFELGDMRVTKAVETDAVDQAGDPIQYDGPFDLAVSCTFLGEEVWADGYDASTPMTNEVGDADVWPLNGLPVGAECEVSETDAAGATGVDVDPGTVTIGGADRNPAEVQAVTVTNTFSVGSLQLTKVVDGPGLDNAPGLAEGPFTFQVTCTLTDASHPDGEVVYDDEVSLSGVAPDNEETIDDLATGAICEIAEKDTGGATEHTLTPDTVTVGDGTTVEVTATNTFVTGSMTVSKEVDSDAVDQDGAPIGYGPFEIAVSCTFRGDAVYGDGYGPSEPMVETIEDGDTWQIDGLPLGASCDTTEPDDADAAATEIDPATVTISGSDPADVAAVTVTNSFDVGSLSLTKEVDGPALGNNPVLGEGPFTLHVTCTLTDASRPGGEVVYEDDVVLEGEQPLAATIEDLPTGAVCEVAETDTGGATDHEVTPDEVTIGDGTTVEVAATNTFEVGAMSVTKNVDSDAVDQDGDPIDYGPFEVAVSCTFEGHDVFADGYDADPMTYEIDDTETWRLTGLPVGARCTVTEPDPADAAEVVISPTSVVIEDRVLPVTVDVDNVYGDGSLHLRKLVEPEGVQDFPISEGPFTMHLTCTLTDASHPDGEVVWDDDIVLEGPQPLEATVDDIAAGSVCVVTEPDPGAASAHVITPRRVTIRDEQTVDVVAVNLFGRGALTVTKVVDGPGAERYGAGPFEVTLSCTYTNVDGDDVPLNTPGGATRELSEDNGYTAEYEPLLYGSVCQVEETATGGATSSVITDAEGEEVSEITIDSLTEDVQLEVTNTFDVGSVVVKKQVDGPGPDRFEVELACEQDVDGTERSVDIPGGAVRVLRAEDDFTARYDELPTGAGCTLVETDDGGAESTTITPNSGDPEVGTFTVGDDTVVRLRVVNRFPDLGPGSGGTDPDGGLLPDTGAGRWLLALLIAGLALAGAGSGMILRSRRGA
ncbi:MAG: DUF5979 domain-containing protein [Nocardioides sp.]